MLLKKINYANYKAFEKKQELGIAPITVLIGKNSSGKSSILKLPMLLSNSFLNNSEDVVIDINHYELDLGYEYKDLLYHKFETRILQFGLEFSYNDEVIQLDFDVFNIAERGKQFISKYVFTSKDFTIYLEAILSENYEISYYGQVGGVDVDECRDLTFAGLIPVWIPDTITEIQKKILWFKNTFQTLFIEQASNINYLLPFRAFPKRIYENRRLRSGNQSHDGSSTPQILFENDALFEQVSEWYRNNLDVDKLSIDPIDRNNRFYEINVYQKSAPKVAVNLCDVGQGISQILPIITNAFMEKGDTIEIIEQPELHLHPGAHGSLATLLINSANVSNTSKYIIETHSENFILRLRRHIAEGLISRSFVNLYWIEYDDENDSSKLRKIEIGADGEVDYWPEGIFSEAFEEIKAIRKAQRSS